MLLPHLPSRVKAGCVPAAPAGCVSAAPAGCVPVVPVSAAAAAAGAEASVPPGFSVLVHQTLAAVTDGSGCSVTAVSEGGAITLAPGLPPSPPPLAASRAASRASLTNRLVPVPVGGDRTAQVSTAAFGAAQLHHYPVIDAQVRCLVGDDAPLVARVTQHEVVVSGQPEVATPELQPARAPVHLWVARSTRSAYLHTKLLHRCRQGQRLKPTRFTNVDLGMPVYNPLLLFWLDPASKGYDLAKTQSEIMKNINMR